MAENAIPLESFRAGLSTTLDEIFEIVHGYMLDPTPLSSKPSPPLPPKKRLSPSPRTAPASPPRSTTFATTWI